MAEDLRVGVLAGATGAKMPFRASQEGALVVCDVGSRFAEASSRDQVFTACNAVAGVAPGTVLSTTPPFCLYNPVNSGKYLEIIRSGCGYVSGTLGAGSIVYAVGSAAQSADPTGGTALVPLSGRIGGSDGLTVAKAFTGSTVAATPKILRPAFVMGAALASSVAFLSLASDPINGEILVAPGNFVCLQGLAAAGTTPLVVLSLTWRELPI